MVKQRFVTAVAVLTMTAWGLGAAGNAGADVTATTNLFPPFPGEYVSTTGTDATVTFSDSADVMYFRLRQEAPTDPQALPAAGGATAEFSSFFDVFTEISTDYGQHFTNVQQISSVPVTFGIAGGNGDNPIEQVTFNFGALTPEGSSILFRESPTVTGPIGDVSVASNPGGGYSISSFFDVFLEVSADSGGTWIPADRSIRLELTPEPATLSLLALGGLVLLRRRRRKA